MAETISRAPIHWKGRAGRALCYLLDPENSPAMPGEWLTVDRPEVDCPACLEWMHA